MSPEPLVLEIAMEPQPIRKTEGEEETPKLTVKVTIKADEKGSYACLLYTSDAADEL